MKMSKSLNVLEIKGINMSEEEIEEIIK